MKKILDWLFGDMNAKATPNAIYRSTILMTIVLTIVIAVLLGNCCPNGSLAGSLTFLTTAAACFAGGGAIGFLFGLPKIASKNKVKSAEDLNNIINDYEDNTNLQELSDWLTKIIVGLSLIKLNKIISWFEAGATSIANAYSTPGGFDFFVFGYGVIVFYFLLGAGLLYLWSRTDLKHLLIRLLTEKEELEVKAETLTNIKEKLLDEKRNLKETVQSLVEKENPADTTKKGKKDDGKKDSEFRASTEKLYLTKNIIDKDDLQRNRWGGKEMVNHYILEADFDKTKERIKGICYINLRVISSDPANPLKGEVAFFLHDTFDNPIRYVEAANNKAELSVGAWEAFVVGARLSDGTELELDLNTVNGFPSDFYWK